MSIQRAYVCCKNCQLGIKGKFEADDRLKSSFSYRNSAMIALEDSAKTMTPLMDFPGKKTEEIEGLVKECLTACMNCKRNYGSSKITNIIDGALKDPDKETQ